MRSIAVASLLLILCVGCSTNEPSPLSLVKLCEAPRPQVCTMEYAPVCGNLIVGTVKDYSSGCNACADDAVASYVPDTCPIDATEGETQ